jgi:hypothetical protein
MVGNGSDGASRLTGQVAGVMAQLPEVVKNLSGVDLVKLMQNLQKDNPKTNSESK